MARGNTRSTVLSYVVLICHGRSRQQRTMTRRAGGQPCSVTLVRIAHASVVVSAAGAQTPDGSTSTKVTHGSAGREVVLYWQFHMKYSSALKRALAIQTDDYYQITLALSCFIVPVQHSPPLSPKSHQQPSISTNIVWSLYIENRSLRVYEIVGSLLP